MYCGLTAVAQNGMEVKPTKLTHLEVKTHNIRMAVLPIGPTEPHANHLPYFTDVLTTDITAARVAAKANAMAADAIALLIMRHGVSSNQAPNPYAQSIRLATMMLVAK